MAQQTAVEWLYNLSQEREPDKFDWEQAKAMEKEQIKFAYNDGAEHIVSNKYMAMEQYYNETYGNYQKLQ